MKRELGEARRRIADLEARVCPDATAIEHEGDALWESLAHNPLAELIFGSPNAMVSLVDRDLVYRTVSPVYEHYFGLKRDDIVGRDAREFFDEKDFDHGALPWLSYCLEGESVVQEQWMRYPALGLRYVHVICTPIRDRQGDVVGVLDIAWDVTHLRDIMKLVQSERDQLNKILGTLNIGLSLINQDLTIAWTNESIKRDFLGKDPVGRKCHDFFRHQNSRCRDCPVREAFETGLVSSVEWYSPVRNVWLLICAQPIRDDQGRITHALEAVTDITERKLYVERLKESDRRVNLAMEVSKAGIWDANLETREMYKSPSLLKLLGLEVDLPPRTIEKWYGYVHQEDLRRVREGFAQVRLERAPEGIWQEYRMRKGNGWIWVRSLMSVVERNEQGGPRRVIGISMDITGERDIREKLQHSEQMYHDIFNSSTDAIMLFDIDTMNIVDANSAFSELFGYAGDEIARLGIDDISQGTYPNSLEGAYENLEVLRQSGSQVLEWWCRKKGGQLFWAEAHVKFMVVQGKQRLFASLRDITGRIQTQQALENRERTLRGILEAAPLLIGLVTQGFVVWSNYQVRAILGYDREEVEGMELSTFFKDEDAYLEIRERFEKQLAKGGMAMLESDLRHKNGSMISVVIRLAPLDPRHPVGDAICTITDISYRKQWELALMEREARYRDIFDNAPVGILRTTLEGRVHQVNQAFADMLGYDSPQKALEAFGRDIRKVYVSGELFDDLRQELQRNKAVKDFEVEWLNRKGECRIMMLNLRYIEEGTQAMIDGFVTDLTQRRRAELDARERDKQLIQADKLISLGILSSGVAHEINNPNNFIGLNAPLLQKAWDALIPVLDSVAETEGDFMIGALPYSRMKRHLPRLLDGISSGSKRIKDIVESMRRLSNPDQQGPSGDLDLNDCVRATLPFINVRLAKNRCQLELDLDKDIPLVKGYGQQVEQVILNLMLNALDAMDRTGGKLLVRTGCNLESGRVEVTVKDHGCGIAPDHLDKLFTPFFTTKRGSGGTGLGLAISEKIMQLHGGGIVLRDNDSEPGATAMIHFPNPNQGQGVAS